MLTIVEGFAGYSLPDDLLSGTGLRAAEGFMRSIPIVGSYVSYFVFGGAFPGEAIIPRLYAVHVLLLPAILVGLFTAHIVLVAVHKHTQYPGPGKTNSNVVGFPMMPVYIAKAGGFFFIVFGVIALISALVTINPIWAYGPYDPSPITAGAQPDWYMGFADGALRLLPGWLEFTTFGFTWSFNVFIGAILLIPVMYTMIGVYPFLEAWVTGDKREHHLLDRPRDRPTRTGIGVAAMTFYIVLFFASGNDIMAIKLHLSINDLTRLFQTLVFVGPPLAFWITKRICLSLQRADRQKVLHGRETGTHLALGRRWLRGDPRAAVGVRALAAGPARVAAAARDHARRRTPTASTARWPARTGSAPRCRTSTSPTASLPRRRPSSRRPTTSTTTTVPPSPASTRPSRLRRPVTAPRPVPPAARRSRPTSCADRAPARLLRPVPVTGAGLSAALPVRSSCASRPPAGVTHLTDSGRAAPHEAEFDQIVAEALDSIPAGPRSRDGQRRDPRRAAGPRGRPGPARGLRGHSPD